MNLDFPLILVIAALVTGVVWLLDALLWAPRRRAAAPDKDGAPRERGSREPLIVEYSRSFFPIIMLVLILRSFVVEPFRIPSGSMMPTLLIGDFILVNKFAYGLRLPVLNKKVAELGEPRRGDVVVFRYPKEPSVDYIKRVVGLPGDHVAYYEKNLYINGKRVDQESIGSYRGFGSGEAMTGASLRMETLGTAEHRILVHPGTRGVEGEFVVPEGHYFVLGDNRDNSNDSRFIGFIERRRIVGKAVAVAFSLDRSRYFVPRMDRFFEGLN